MFFLKYYVIYWIVVIIHDITSLKGRIAFCPLWKLSVEFVFELKCKLSRLLYRSFSSIFIISKFYIDIFRCYAQKVCLSMMLYLSQVSVDNQRYYGEIGIFYNKLRVIKCYYNLLDIQRSYSASMCDFRSLLMVLNLLASFHFKSLVYYIVIILPCIRRDHFYALTFSYIFQVILKC